MRAITTVFDCARQIDTLMRQPDHVISVLRHSGFRAHGALLQVSVIY
jgi:hypothetical protein